ncbi:MAG: ABC transporter ATP-binding protein [Candidatus Hadarchaeia archaeon]
MNAVELENLTKHYGNEKAVKGVNFNIPEGEFFGLLGPNGAGKTTLISMLVGLTTPTAGSARVFGKDILEDYREVHAKIGIAPGEENFDREFDVYDNLYHHAGYFSIPGDERKRKAEKYLKMFDLWDKRNVKPFHLSQGMNKKLLLARAMMTDPHMLILDEPTAGLDVTAKRDTQKYVKELNQNGLTIMLTTHQLGIAENLCEKVAIIDKGEILAIGSPKRLIEKGKSDIVRIKMKNRINEIPKSITKPEYQVDLKRGGKEIRLIASDGGSATVEAVELLHKEENIEPKSVKIEKADLEDVFTRLTEGNEN